MKSQPFQSQEGPDSSKKRFEDFFPTPEQRAAKQRALFNQLLEGEQRASPEADSGASYFPANRLGWAPSDPDKVREAEAAFSNDPTTPEIPLPPPRPEDEDIE